MAVSHDGRFIVTGHGNGAVLLWSWLLNSQAWSRQVLLRHAAAVRGLAFAPDGRTLVTVGRDGRLFVTLPVDIGRWQARGGQATLPDSLRARSPGAAGVRMDAGSPGLEPRHRAWRSPSSTSAAYLPTTFRA